MVPKWRFFMAEDEKAKNAGTVFLTFLAGAVLGAGIALLVAAQRKDDDDSSYDEADLFV
jgi:hypothetical protein